MGKGCNVIINYILLEPNYLLNALTKGFLAKQDYLSLLLINRHEITVSFPTCQSLFSA
jgi:hypothetical protein